MPPPMRDQAPGLKSFLKMMKSSPGAHGLESSIEQFVSLLKRRQIRDSRPCAIATTQLLLRVVAEFKGRHVEKLMMRIRQVGQRLIYAQPREMVVGNIVRRVLGMVREVCEGDHNDDGTLSNSDPSSPRGPSPLRPVASISKFSPLKKAAVQPVDMAVERHHQDDAFPFSFDGAASRRPVLLTSHTSYAVNGPTDTSLFGIFSNPAGSPASSTPLHGSGYATPDMKPVDLGELSLIDKLGNRDIKAEIIDGIKEIGDEIDQCAEQIAAYAVDHIHADEIVLVHGMSHTLQTFLLTAAKKRKFTAVLVESDTEGPSILQCGKTSGVEDDNDQRDQLKALTHKNLNIIIIPPSAVFAIMSRINKVLLATHAVLANGGLVASIGAYNIAHAARAHNVPVVVLSGVYKLSPMYPFNPDELVEWGDAGAVGEDLCDGVEVSNPVKEYVPEGLVELYITNLGGHAPSYLYRIVQDHYDNADTNL